MLTDGHAEKREKERNEGESKDRHRERRKKEEKRTRRKKTTKKSVMLLLGKKRKNNGHAILIVTSNSYSLCEFLFQGWTDLQTCMKTKGQVPHARPPRLLMPPKTNVYVSKLNYYHAILCHLTIHSNSGFHAQSHMVPTSLPTPFCC